MSYEESFLYPLNTTEETIDLYKEVHCVDLER